MDKELMQKLKDGIQRGEHSIEEALMKAWEDAKALFSKMEGAKTPIVKAIGQPTNNPPVPTAPEETASDKTIPDGKH